MYLVLIFLTFYGIIILEGSFDYEDVKFFKIVSSRCSGVRAGVCMG